MSINTLDNYNNINFLLEQYLVALDRYNDEIFALTPAPGVWSLSEVYSHIMFSNLLCMKAIDKCVEGRGVENGSGLNIMGLFVLGVGGFPPVKIKAPERVGSSVRKITKQEAKNMIAENASHLEAVIDSIPNVPSNQKVPHPRLGNLNAQQWMHFIKIHTNHHLKQLKRIEKQLTQKSSQ